MRDECRYHNKNDGSWWEYDGRGIVLFRVCELCQKEKLATVRPEILGWYDNRHVDEQIEDDY